MCTPQRGRQAHHPAWTHQRPVLLLCHQLRPPPPPLLPPDYWERAEFPFELVPKLKSLGLGGGTIRGNGCAVRLTATSSSSSSSALPARGR